MARLRLAVIGVGHLGKEHARILSSLPDIDLVGVVDINADQAQAVARRCSTRAYADYWPLLNLVDAAVIVVPTTYHHAIASEFLRSGIPVLVEKPLALNLAQTEALVELARSHGVLLQVGHIERFNSVFEELARRPLRPKFVECERSGPYTGRSTDIGAVLDLMIHDLDLLLALLPAPVLTVEALGMSIFGSHEDVAHARLRFGDGCVANLTASRASASPVRRMRIWAAEGYASLDFHKHCLTFIQPSEQLRRQGLDLCHLDAAGLAMLKNDLFGRHLQVLRLDRSGPDQLTRELQDFVHAVQTGAPPRVSGEDGYRAMALACRILEAIQAHQWEGCPDGPIGPFQPPVPTGSLFQPGESEAAA